MIVFLAVVVGALAVAVGVLIYQRSQPVPVERRRGEGAARILSGILSAYTGGLSNVARGAASGGATGSAGGAVGGAGAGAHLGLALGAP